MHLDQMRELLLAGDSEEAPHVNDDHLAALGTYGLAEGLVLDFLQFDRAGRLFRCERGGAARRSMDAPGGETYQTNSRRQ
jgi:hypothetical protein